MSEIETARLRLRMFTPDDVEDLARLFGDPRVMRYLGEEAGKTLSRDEAAHVLNNLIEGWQRRGFGRWAIIEKEAGRFIGLCGLKLLGAEVELVCVLEENRWGRGLAAEATRAALRYGFEELKLERIVAVTRPENVASQRAMKSVGMSCTGEARYYGVEAVGYTITREEHEPDDSPYVVRRE